MTRGLELITKDQAIEFCRERKELHMRGADNFLQDPETDIIENEIDRVKYNSRVDLANIYGDIVDLLSR